MTILIILDIWQVPLTTKCMCPHIYRLRHLDNLPCTPLYIGYESESVNTNPPPPHGVVVLEKQELKQKEGARLRSSCAQQQCSRVVVEHNVQESRSFVQKYDSGLQYTGLFYAMIIQIKWYLFETIDFASKVSFFVHGKILVYGDCVSWITIAAM